ncbi:hypothetical protein [uncultured Akkermansia sp.]|uniref:tetratricopeptide repeat protein n=1 Tax=uncultured Akkermansia sp. TaxID=512294 RepID=UPI00265CBE25|nr:hypothetical protein [uncultured Akkermansia sp.]
MKVKSGLIISGIVLVAALGVYWIAIPRESSPEELYRQYMQLSPFEQFEQRDMLLKKAAHAGYIPAMLQMANHNFISKNDLKSDEYNYWMKKAADHGSPQAQYEAFTESISENPSEILFYLMQADRQSYAPASLELGQLYMNGDEDYGIVRDEQKAMELYQKAASLNHPEALYLVYLMEKLGIPLKEKAGRTSDSYDRYRQQAEQQKAFPIMPPGISKEELQGNQFKRRITDILKAYLPQNPKAVEWIKKNYGGR